MSLFPPLTKRVIATSLLTWASVFVLFTPTLTDVAITSTLLIALALSLITLPLLLLASTTLRWPKTALSVQLAVLQLSVLVEIFFIVVNAVLQWDQALAFRTIYGWDAGCAVLMYLSLNVLRSRTSGQANVLGRAILPAAVATAAAYGSIIIWAIAGIS